MNTSQLIKKELEIMFRANKLQEIYHENTIINLINLKNNIYILRTKSVKIEILTLKTKNSIQFWHNRMNHLRYKDLMKLNHIIDKINIVDFISKEIFDDCMIERQQRKINRTYKIRVNAFLNSLHSDLIKSFLFTRKNKRYHFIFKNDFINVILTYLMKFKDITFEKYQKFKSIIENQSNTKIKCLKADDEKKFIDDDFQEFLIKNKIQ